MSTVRALMLSPVASDAYLAMVGLDSGTMQRWDLRSSTRPLDVVRLAHSSPILDMDWLPPTGSTAGRGWLATASMDKTVKVRGSPAFGHHLLTRLAMGSV